MEGEGRKGKVKEEELKAVYEKSKTEKCPAFNGNSSMFREWKGKLNDWRWMTSETERYPGITVRANKTGEAWELIEHMSTEELSEKDGVDKIMKVLEKKYGSDKRRVKMESMNEFFGIERREDEGMQDFISRFDVSLRKCIAYGMDSFTEEQKGGMLFGRCKLSKDDEKIMLGALDGVFEYEIVTNQLIGILGKSMQKSNEKVWMEKREGSEEGVMKGGAWKKEGYVRKVCQGKEECERCGRGGHDEQECLFRERTCYRCKKKGHAANKCDERKKEVKEIVLLGDESENDEEKRWELIRSILEPGCSKVGNRDE